MTGASPASMAYAGEIAFARLAQNSLNMLNYSATRASDMCLRDYLKTLVTGF